MSAVTYAELGSEDVREAARLHRVAFPGFFLSQLGEGFLREFYRAFLLDGSVTVVARDDAGRVVGVVVGSTEPDGFFRRLLLRRWYAFAVHSLRLVLTRPSVVPRLVRAVTYRGHVPDQPDGALLSSICVSPAAQGAGVGRELIRRWTSELGSRGVHDAYLTTDAADNDATNAFYVRSGWRLVGSHSTPEGRSMNTYTWQDGTA